MHLKKHLRGQCHDDDDSVKMAIFQWLSVADFCDDRIQKELKAYMETELGHLEECLHKNYFLKIPIDCIEVCSEMLTH